MSLQDRRSSLVNIDEWLDRCPGDKPDSVIYEPDYCNEVAIIRTRQREPEIENLYRIVADMCTEIGLTPNLVEERLNDIDECITTFLNTIQKDVQDEYNKLCQYKQDLLDQVVKMMKDLYLPDYVPDENLTLLQHCKRLKTKFNELNIVKQTRMTRLQELRDKQTRHCLILGIKTPQFKTLTDIPTEEELKCLATTVLEMEKEEARRKAKYLKLKNDIEKLMEELEYKPQTEFETIILSDKPNYSESYLTQMSNFHSKLELQHAKNKELFEKLTTKLISLYDRLDTPQEERDIFLSSHKVCSPTLMLEIEVEIEHYELLKKKNIGKFVEKIKNELIVEYEKCFLSREEQDNFFSLFTVNTGGEYSEELLELCERELDRVKRYYQDNKEILDKFQKWRMMWKELIDIESKANDPSRFTNRGGQLLLEEKKRKTLQKGLPKIEKELYILTEEYAKRSENNEKFKVLGTNLDEHIANCWDELNHAKEEEKKERQRAKMKSAPRVPLVKKTPVKRPLGAGITPTPNKSSVSRILKSSTSALSMSEQEFEDMIVTCPASAKKGR